MKKADSIRELRKKVKKVQDVKRFEHSLGVEFTAASLAMKHGVSINDARLAGILHDCAKCLTDEKRIKICEKYHIEMSETERRNPFLLHGKVGAFLAEHRYGVTNKDILNAICYHTTGRPEMSELEKIVFIADYIEPSRKQAKNLGEIRKLAFENLDSATIRILEDTLLYLKQKGGELDPATEETYRYYKELQNERIIIRNVTGGIRMTAIEAAKLAIESLEDKKAEDIRVIDISEVSVIADYFIIAAGSNRSQIQALCDNVEEKLGRAGVPVKQIEGYDTANWILLDFGDIIVHIFDKENRLLYDLERIWRDGKVVTFE